MTLSPSIKPHGSQYDDSYPGILHDYALKNPYLNAASTYAIADVFGVSRQTIANWMKAHEEFRAEIERLRIRELRTVESAMMKRIIGCTVTEKRTEKTADGTVERTVEKELAPDPALIRYYLSHRAPECWSGREERNPRQGDGAVTLVVEHDPEEFA